MNLKVTVVLVAAALALGIYTGKTMFAKTMTVEVEKEVVRTDIVTVVREIIKPDGTKETISTLTDKSVARKDSSHSTSKAETSPNWHISASAARSLESAVPVYGLQIERRILGPISVGINVNSERQIGLVVGYEF